MNILLIITDQQCWNAVGYRQKFIKTPNIDELEKRSFSTTAFVQSPQCQPSRASMMTGRYPSSLRLWWNEMELSPRERTIANILNDVGYTTAYFGKWHIHKDHQWLQHFGWDPELSYLTHNWRSGDGLPAASWQSRNDQSRLMKTKNWAGKMKSRNWSHEDTITEKAIRFMTQCKQPFFATVSYYGPHPPYSSPPPFCDLYQISGAEVVRNYNGELLSVDDMRLVRSQYYGCISWIDDCIGKLLDSLPSETLVIFTSDHGDMLGEHGYFSKGLFAYDQVIRVPLLISMKKIKPKRYERLVEMIDLLPTILWLLGIESPPGIQGLSLEPAISGGQLVRSRVLSVIGYNRRLRMVRTEQSKYWICNDRETLFDLLCDPLENDNVAETNPNLLSVMRLEMIKALMQSEDLLQP